MRRQPTILQTIVTLLATSAADGALAQAPPQGVAVRITLDADAVDIVRAMRRRDGLDPPDAAADARIARLLQRQRERRGHLPESSAAPPAHERAAHPPPRRRP